MNNGGKKMTDMQLMTLVVTLLAIFAAMYGTRKSTEDMRDVLRAEWKAGVSEMRAEVRTGVGEIRAELKLIDNKLDHVVETQARHSERLDHLEKKG
jgi:hypothetical protein